MLITGTVVADAETVIEDGAVRVSGSRIDAVGTRASLVDHYPDDERRTVDVVAPGLVGAHVHSVQSLGRGIADDAALLEWLFDHVLPMEATMDADATRIAAELGYLECIESGTTTVLDHLTVDHSAAAFEAARELGIRGRLGKVLMDADSPDGLEQDTETALAETESLIREYHGTTDGRLRYAITPRFALSCTEACLRGCRELADRYDDVRIHTHASENRDEIAAVERATGMRNVHWLDEVGLTGPDVTLAHCVHTDETEREVLAETDTVVTHCPSSNMKLASGVAPIADYLDRGITVALGNDGPPCNNTLDPFTEMRQASLLGKVDAHDPTRLPAATVLRMATEAGARAAGFDRIGALREGYRADVIGLTTEPTRATPVHDPVSHLVYAAHGDDVTLTVIDGEVRYADGEHVDVDAAAIRERARRHAERVVPSA
ncbi:5'-deoxyadenosine deaminase [Halopenitus sp. POP-27]|uniref:5'-deoxyadenosine deaminase n=1 Tax=Halopenitus sp. POP-27 TaxID=2994425 RepID=UPI0024683907|nr:5'-deoxyadenosine deaminase [Halopenitus sp. POP-27]